MWAGWDLDMAWTGFGYGLYGTWDYGIGSGWSHRVGCIQGAWPGRKAASKCMMDVSNYYGYEMGMKMGWRALVNTVMYDVLAARASKTKTKYTTKQSI